MEDADEESFHPTNSLANEDEEVLEVEASTIETEELTESIIQPFDEKLQDIKMRDMVEAQQKQPKQQPRRTSMEPPSAVPVRNNSPRANVTRNSPRRSPRLTNKHQTTQPAQRKKTTKKTSNAKHPPPNSQRQQQQTVVHHSPPTQRSKPRGLSYRFDEIDNLLTILEEIQPIGPQEWEQVLEKHNEKYGDLDRQAEGLRRKFRFLCAKRTPTGNPDCPPEVRRAKKIAKWIEERSEACDGEEDDNLGFEEGNGNTDNNNNNNAGDAMVEEVVVTQRTTNVQRQEGRARPLSTPRRGKAAEEQETKKTINDMYAMSMIQSQNDTKTNREDRKLEREDREIQWRYERAEREEVRRLEKEERERRELREMEEKRLEREEKRRDREESREERRLEREVQRQQSQAMMMMMMSLIGKNTNNPNINQNSNPLSPSTFNPTHNNNNDNNNSESKKEK